MPNTIEPDPQRDIPTNPMLVPAAHETSAAEDSAGVSTAADPESAFAPPVESGEIGRMAGRYRVLKKLGQGGMGAVYVAFDEHLQRKVALKIMLPRYAANSNSRARFLREARATAKLGHDNVVTIFEAAEADGIPFLAMQLLQGYPLDDFVKRKGLPTLPQVVRIGRDVAAALAAAHAVGIVHRDVKPGNLWLEAPNGRVKVLDFGLAKPVDGSGGNITQGGGTVGTPTFMSPEQARCENVDGRSDLFSLGSVLYYLCTGRLPFSGANEMSVLVALRNHEPPPVKEVNPEVPAALAALIDRLLAKDVAQRCQSAMEVVAALDAIKGELSAVRNAPPLLVTSASIDLSAQPECVFANLDTVLESTPNPRRAPSEKRRRWPAVAIAAAVLFIVGAIAASLLSDGGSKSTSEQKPPVEAKAKPHEPKPKTPADSDRRAAEMILRNDGGITYRIPGQPADRSIPQRSPANPTRPELPPGPIQLTGVVSLHLLNESQVEMLLGLEHLTAVRLEGVQSDNGVRRLLTSRSARNWKHLKMGCKDLTDETVRAICQACPELESISLKNCPLLTDASCSHLAQLHRLTGLVWAGVPFTDAGLKHLRKHDLGSLVIFDGKGITDEGLRHIGAMTDLTILTLVGAAATDAGFEFLRPLVKLVHLDLRGTRCTDRGLDAIASLKTLTTLDLDGLPITDVGLTKLHGLTALNQLNVRMTKVTPGGVAKLKAALPKCKVMSDAGK